MASSEDSKVELEMKALADVYAALNPLDPMARAWVVRTIADRLQIEVGRVVDAPIADRGRPESTAEASPEAPVAPPSEPHLVDSLTSGISSPGKKWMQRNALEPSRLVSIFSIGQDEIDLVLTKLPGSKKRERMRNVLFLLGLSQYLATGVARVQDAKLREACSHYNAYDLANFSKYMKEFDHSATGTKQAGYSLTASGMNAATELVKSLVGSSPT